MDVGWTEDKGTEVEVMDGHGMDSKGVDGRQVGKKRGQKWDG